MIKVIAKNSIKIGKESVVILPLKKWEEIKKYFEELEGEKRKKIPEKAFGIFKKKSGKESSKFYVSKIRKSWR